MNKKVVFLPYDMDTALGINNEGALVFGYGLEDTDKVGNADVFNGQDSVLWNNLRDTFGPELKTLYQQLRSTGAISYEKVEQMFEAHQSKWPEAVFNEDAFFKYIQPLIDDGDESYLSMLQGSKAEQRKWWLYNRFKYLDSKYNAGDSLTDYIQLRGYAKDDITVTPYADIYVTIKWASYLRQQRGVRNTAYLMECPLDNVNDSEIYIYSASQLSSVGDLSGLKIGFADFHNATKLQELILGSTAMGYSNPNLRSINVGNLKLLKKIDVRNCTGLGTYADQKSVDLSGCTGLEEVYFDGTNVLSVELPNGGFLDTLHLPGTITNLTIRNQPNITEFVCPNFSHLTTLHLENNGDAIYVDGILDDLSPGCRIRIFNYYFDFASIAAVNAFLDKFDNMTGMDQNGDNVEKPQIFATVHVPSATGDDIDAIHERYPDITVDADVANYYLRYYSQDGETLLYTETVAKGSNGAYSVTQTKSSTAQYSYSFAGWSTAKNSTSATTGATENIQSNTNVYAAFSQTTRTYTITFVRANADGGGTLQTSVLAYGATPSYTGSTPTSTQTGGGTRVFEGWYPAIAPVTGDATYTAVFMGYYTITFVRAAEDGGGTLQTLTNVATGTVPVYTGSTPTTTKTDFDYKFTGWTPTIVAANGNATYTATFAAIVGLTRPTIDRTIRIAEHSTVSNIRNYAFAGCSSLTTASFPSALIIGHGAFKECSYLTTISTPSVTSIENYAFAGCVNLTTFSFPSVTHIGENAFSKCNEIITASFPVATYIGSSAFTSCAGLKTAIFPVVTSIGAYAFNFCYRLETISFPVVTRIRSYAFRSCSAIETAIFPSATIIERYAFNNCNKLTTISFPVVESIYSSAFYFCKALTIASFPAAKFIDNYAFGNCSSLSALILASTSMVSCGGYAVLVNANNAIIYVNDDLVSAYKSARNWNSYASRIKGISEFTN